MPKAKVGEPCIWRGELATIVAIEQVPCVDTRTEDEKAAMCSVQWAPSRFRIETSSGESRWCWREEQEAMPTAEDLVLNMTPQARGRLLYGAVYKKAKRWPLSETEKAVVKLVEHDMAIVFPDDEGGA